MFNSSLRDNADGTCNCRPLGNGCFFTDKIGRKCDCKCHFKQSMTNIEQIIARQEKDIERIIKGQYPDLFGLPEGEHNVLRNMSVWLEESYINSLIDLFKEINKNSIKRILEGVEQVEKEKLGIVRNDVSIDGSIGYEKAKIDTINYIESIIKKL